jgi:hypothetical protein
LKEKKRGNFRQTDYPELLQIGELVQNLPTGN